jgi:TetR/AcrR family transcriptional regulator, transcriptional repressor for nem operon
MGRVSQAKEQLMQAVLDLIWEQSYGSVTVDDICARAQAHKGSFYYFFKSKSDLTVHALDYDWQKKCLMMNEAFSPDLPPLQRLSRYFDSVYTKQKELHHQHGRVLGCPIFTLGSEVCTHEPEIGMKIHQLIGNYTAYFEKTLQEAAQLNNIPPGNAAERSRLLFNYFEGALTQARIQNNPDLLKNLAQEALEFIQSRSKTVAA